MENSIARITTENGVKYNTIDCGESGYGRRAIVTLGVGMQEDELCAICTRHGASDYSISTDTSDGEYGGLTMCGECIEGMQKFVANARKTQKALDQERKSKGSVTTTIIANE